MSDNRKEKKKPIARRVQREIAVQLLFEMKAQSEERVSFIEEYFSIREMDPKDHGYTVALIETYLQHRERIEEIIRENVHGWRVERVGKIEISIIRIATVEMLYFEDVPAAVSINEAVEITKRFADEIAYRFVNKVLRNIYEAIEK